MTVRDERSATVDADGEGREQNVMGSQPGRVGVCLHAVGGRSPACAHTPVCTLCSITAAARVFLSCTVHLHYCDCVWVYSWAITLFQLVGGHAELASNCLEILNSACRRLPREGTSGRERSVC